MDIQKRYFKQAQLYLNSSILVLIPAFISILFILKYADKKLMMLVSLFLLYSLFLFQNYLLNYKRFLITSKKLKVKAIESNEIMTCMQFILQTDKDQKELLLFHPSGSLLGKIVRGTAKQGFQLGNWLYPKKFVLLDNFDRMLASYYLKDGMVDVYHFERGYIGGFTSSKNRSSRGIFQYLNWDKISTLERKLTFMDDLIVTAEQESVFRVRKGLMSLECQELFRNPNSPVLTISPSLEGEERLLYLALLVDRFF